MLSEGLTPGQTGGAFMIAYMIPPLLTGWFAGRLTARWGKKKMALTALLVGSLLSALIAVLRSPVASIAVIFAVSFCWSFVWPAVSAAYSEYISRSDAPRRSVETIDDLSINLGDILGPIIIGYSAQFLGLRNAFAVTGALGALIALVLFRFAPKRLIAAPTPETHVHRKASKQPSKKP
jgi:MFS family permease